MANAMEILGDSDIIYRVFEGKFLNFYKSDDETAIFLKKYINEAVARAQKYHDDYQILYNEQWGEYKIKYQRWIKHGRNGPSPTYMSSHRLNDSKHFIELKVNHYRQKFWYWKKLKE